MEKDVTNNRYYFQELDNFPYNMQEVVEALNYALSYNSQDVNSLCLMGRVHAEILGDYSLAKQYFEAAIAVELYALPVYPHYADCLLNNEDYPEAEKLINFALTIKGVNKGVMLQKKASLYDSLHKWKKASKALKKARLYANTTSFMHGLDEQEKMIKQKIPQKKNRS